MICSDSDMYVIVCISIVSGATEESQVDETTDTYSCEEDAKYIEYSEALTRLLSRSLNVTDFNYALKQVFPAGVYDYVCMVTFITTYTLRYIHTYISMLAN